MENSSPNGKGLGFTEGAAAPEVDKALTTPWEALVCLPGHPHENKGSAQGPARKAPEEATGAVLSQSTYSKLTTKSTRGKAAQAV